MNDVQPVTNPEEVVETPVVPVPEVVEGDETAAPATDAPAA